MESSTTLPTRVTSRTNPAAGHRLVIARGLVTLVSVTLVVWLLSLLGRLDPSPPAIGSVRDADGTTLWWIDEGPGSPVRVVLAARSVELDREARHLRIGRERWILPSTPTVLVHSDGRLEPVPHAVPAPLLEVLRRPARDGMPLSLRLRDPRIRQAFERAGILLLRFGESS